MERGVSNKGVSFVGVTGVLDVFTVSGTPIIILDLFVEMTTAGIFTMGATGQISFELGMTGLPAAIIPVAMMRDDAQFVITGNVGFNLPDSHQLVGRGQGGNLVGGPAQLVSFTFDITYVPPFVGPLQQTDFTLSGMYRIA